MFKYFKVIIKLIFPITWIYFTCLLPYSIHPEKRSLEKRFFKIQKIIKKIFKAFNVNFHTEDLTNFYKCRNNEDNYLFVCNHLSLLDPLIFIALAPRPISFVAKIETKKIPLVARAIKILDGEFMDRDDLKQSLKVMLRVENKLKNTKNLDFMIFPEGTRNKEDIYKTLVFHHGTFRPAMKAKKSIVSFALTGNDKILSLKDKSKKYDVYIKLVKIYEPKNYENLKTMDIAIDCQNETNKKLAIIKEELMS